MARAEATRLLSSKSSSVLALSPVRILHSSSHPSLLSSPLFAPPILPHFPCSSSALSLSLSMSRLSSPSPTRAETTSCGSLLRELQDLWDEIGENDFERDRQILQLEQECLDLYKRKVDKTRKTKAELHQMLAEGEAEISRLISTLGERETFVRIEKATGTLKEQLAMIKPLLEDLRLKKEERIKDFLDVQSQIVRICEEIAGHIYQESSACPQVDERDLTLKRLGELKCQLHELQKDKNLRLQKVNDYIKSIHDISVVLSVDFNMMISEVHPTFVNFANSLSKSISNDTLGRLAGTVHSLKQEKTQRLKMLQSLGNTLFELWNLMDTPIEEQKRFDHVTRLISSSLDSVVGQGCLALAVIEQVEHEVKRLDLLKASKMKEIVLKKQNELDEIYGSVHMDVDAEEKRKMLISHIDSGKVDLSELLSSMDDQILKAKEQALSRKDILEKVEKWKFASEEENWLDDYEKDENRYSAGRGVHKNLKRAEKARVLANKLPVLADSLTAKIKAWEEDKGMPFMYDKVRLMDCLEEYIKFRQQREEEKRRSREQKKLHEQFTTEQETLYGTKPSPMRPMKKPLGQSSCVNMAWGTPNSRRISTPFARQGILSSGKEKKGGKGNLVIPINYVSLPKNDSLSHNNPAAVSLENNGQGIVD